MRLLFIGDVMLAGRVNARLEDKPASYPWGDTIGLLRCADIRVCNLECVISDHGSGTPATAKAFRFRSSGKNIAALTEGGIDVVSLANNHVLDYGEEALLDMLASLRRSGIHYVGAGRNCAEACGATVINHGGTTVGVLAFTDNQPDWEAGEGNPGICHAPVELANPRLQQLLNVVRATHSRVDCLVVSVHWGSNWGARPPARQRAVAKALLDAGAQIVFGHSPHVFRGIELHCKKVIIYSAGDFIDDYLAHPTERNDESFIFVVDLAGAEVAAVLLHPIVVRAFQARLAGTGIADEAASRMAALCAELGTATTWHRDERCLRITVPPSASSH